MTDYFVILGASRIANASRVDQSGVDDGDVTGWTKTDDFIIATRIYTSKGPIARAYKLRWRDVTDVGSFADVGSTGEITYNAATDLADDTTVIEAEKICDAQSGYTWQNGYENEGDNILPNSGTYNLTDEYYTELQWALDCSNAEDGHEYEFELYDTTLGASIGTCLASITMASGQEYTINKNSDFRILGEETKQKTSDFRVLAPDNTIQKTANFAVVIENLLQKNSNFRVKGEQLIQKNSDFRVKVVDNTVQKNSDFRVLVPDNTVQKASDFRVLGEETKQKPADFRVKGEETIQKTANFRVTEPGAGGGQGTMIDWVPVIAPG